MIVKLIPSGESQEVNASYGARLIEQGSAVLAPEQPKKQAAKDKAAEA